MAAARRVKGAGNNAAGQMVVFPSVGEGRFGILDLGTHIASLEVAQHQTQRRFSGAAWFDPLGVSNHHDII